MITELSIEEFTTMLGDLLEQNENCPTGLDDDVRCAMLAELAGVVNKHVCDYPERSDVGFSAALQIGQSTPLITVDDRGGSSNVWSNYGTLVSLKDVGSCNEQFVAPAPMAVINKTGTYSFEISEEDGSGGVVGGRLTHRHGGLLLGFDGYSNFISGDNEGYVVSVEYYNGRLAVVVYADINSEEPTHIADLASAANGERIVEPLVIAGEGK